MAPERRGVRPGEVVAAGLAAQRLALRLPHLRGRQAPDGGEGRELAHAQLADVAALLRDAAAVGQLEPHVLQQVHRERPHPVVAGREVDGLFVAGLGRAEGAQHVEDEAQRLRRRGEEARLAHEARVAGVLAQRRRHALQEAQRDVVGGLAHVVQPQGEAVLAPTLASRSAP